MKFTDDQLRATAAILHQVVTSDDVKLRWGGQKRMEIKAALDRGEKVGGYRVSWIQETRMKIVGVLSEAAADFNREYPHDKISAADMTDVLASTLHQFQQALRRKKENEDAS